MKKVFSLLAVLALVCMAGTAFAAGSVTQKAYATFSEESLDITVTLYEWVKDKEWSEYTPKASGDIQFDVSNIELGKSTPKYANATTFAKVSSNLTGISEGTTIYLYTKNASASYNGEYKAAAKDGNGKYSGLIRKGNTSPYQPGDHAPIRVAFSKLSDFSKSNGAHHDYVGALPDFSTGGINGNARFWTTGFRNLNDKDDDIFGSLPDLEKVLGISGLNGGFWVCEKEDHSGSWYSGDEDVLIFFGAAFDHVIGGSKYGTETITFGAITE